MVTGGPAGLGGAFVVGDGLDLVGGHVEQDLVVLGGGLEVQRAPDDGDAAVADAHEAAEIDDGGAGLALFVDEDVDDAADGVAGRVADGAAEDAGRLALSR